MGVNAKKFVKKFEKTWPAHVISAAGFMLGVFAPLAGAVTLGVATIAALGYEMHESQKQDTFANKAKKSFQENKAAVKNAFRNIFSDNKEANDANAMIDMFGLVENRHVAMASIATGTLTGILIGMVIMFSPVALVVPLSMSIVATVALTAIGFEASSSLKEKIDPINNGRKDALDKNVFATEKPIRKEQNNSVKEKTCFDSLFKVFSSK
jgi:hypothetical protein